MRSILFGRIESTAEYDDLDIDDRRMAEPWAWDDMSVRVPQKLALWHHKAGSFFRAPLDRKGSISFAEMERAHGHTRR